MPKLNKKQQQTVDKAEGGTFEPLPAGRYVATLQKVEVKPGNVADQWSWEFGNIVDTEGQKRPGRQWVNTSLSEKAAWKMKEVFEALGYSLDSDTDEMIGEKAVLHLKVEIAERGARQGEKVNRVDRVAPYDEDEWDLPTEGDGDAGDDDF
jgi:hypothetical protein